MRMRARGQESMSAGEQEGRGEWSDWRGSGIVGDGGIDKPEEGGIGWEERVRDWRNADE